MTYQSTIQYLYDCLPVFHHIGGAAYKPGLDNTIRLMNALGNPQKQLKTIHVAGTNGKGSVSHFLAAILQSSGFKTGLYTSPHLVDFGERIRLNGKMINQQYVIDFVEQNKELCESVQPSFFELTMAMAFKYFADEQVDIAVIEVGMGGRLDSTNIIEPMLSVITNISFDHVAFLGNTLEKIAFEKAGIIKKNTPVVIGEWQAETMPVFVQKAKEEGSSLVLSDEIIKKIRYEHGKMLVENEKKKQYIIGLSGDYQLKNVATVLCAVKVFNETIRNRALADGEIMHELTNADILSGLENVVEMTGLLGRWQLLREQPTVVADTGHNVGGIEYVVEQLKHQDYEKLHIIIGMVNDKDINTVLKLLPINARYYFTQAAVLRALPAVELQKQAKSYGLNGDSYITVKESVDDAIKNAGVKDFVFIGGSNFVVGEALEYFNQ
ncbi:MAG: folylpolyglutamate synthase/dihydrofolate synthase family protein [Paludibacter sp.]|nr:folylpolyglutamate synthase/dihydrofolate synthase family protein [Paludibacter sp.]